MDFRELGVAIGSKNRTQVMVQKSIGFLTLPYTSATKTYSYDVLGLPQSIYKKRGQVWDMILKIGNN